VSATTRGFQAVTWNRNANDLFAGKWLRAPVTISDKGFGIFSRPLGAFG